MNTGCHSKEVASRIMAHAIICDGMIYRGLHVAQLTPGDKKITVYPCDTELHSTRFFNGCVAVSVSADGQMVVTPAAYPLEAR